MGNIAVLSTDDETNKAILQVCTEFGDEFVPIYLRDKNRIVQHLNYELPEIIVVNYADKYIKLKTILKEIRSDPWLHSGGFVIIHDEESEGELLKGFEDINMLAAIEKGKLEDYFTRLLRILSQNRGILFQRDLHFILQANLSGCFVLENDPFDLDTYSNLLANFLLNCNLIDHEQRERFKVATMELLQNAIEHGNCRISYKEKTRWLDSGGDILDLIRQKNKDPEIASKKVYLDYRITPKKSTFRIRDEGSGFDWKSHSTVTGEDGLKELHGRGIAMASHFVSRLSYNDRGNEVNFEINHLTRDAKVFPKVFSDPEEVKVKDGDVVFTQGEKSSYLYYIVSGQYEIIANGKRVSVLAPEDIYLGEMSFLLDNRRSATVKAMGQGTLLKISKEAFINAIKERPHYGIFLARFLAQRLVKLHKVTTV